MRRAVKIMTTSDSVALKVAAIARHHLEERFGRQLVFHSIRVIPEAERQYHGRLGINVVYHGDNELLNPRRFKGIYGRMRPELLALGITYVPVERYTDRTQDGEWSEPVQATPVRSSTLVFDNQALAERPEFERLADEWERARPRGVDIEQMTAHPAYQQIIDMGTPAVPWLLRRLEQRPGHWFAALNRITGAQPVPPESLGRFKEMTVAWLEWGRLQGYEWQSDVD